MNIPTRIAIFGIYADMTIVLSFASYFGLIFVPSALLTAYLLRLTVLHKSSPRAPT